MEERPLPGVCELTEQEDRSQLCQQQHQDHQEEFVVGGPFQELFALGVGK
jgi:hypothetical protein